MPAVREPGAQQPPVRMPPASMIVLDKGKVSSTVHGDRTPEDPMYRVARFQDGLPFDANGNLVPDDGDNQPRTVIVDGKPVVFQPLWDDKKRLILKHKLERLARHLPDEDNDPSKAAAAAKADEEQEVDEVNLEEWLRGRRKYEMGLLRKAMLKKIGVVVPADAPTKFIVRKLVLDEQFCGPDEVAEQFRVHLKD